MLIFIALALGAFILVAGGFLFGHDHDVGHDIDHDHEIGGDAEGTISVFSVKVLATFIMGFGAAGAIARYYGSSFLVSSIIGVGCGIVLAMIMYGVLLLFVRQQASSSVRTESLLGEEGTVTVEIDAGSTGEVGLSAGGEYRTYAARSGGRESIAKGSRVKVVDVRGSSLTVEQA